MSVRVDIRPSEARDRLLLSYMGSFVPSHDDMVRIEHADESMGIKLYSVVSVYWTVLEGDGLLSNAVASVNVYVTEIE